MDIHESLEVYADTALLEHIDLIVPLWTMGSITPEQMAGLDRAVRAGTGIAGWHGGIADAFRDNVTYQFMIGGQFVAHPGGIIDYAVEPTGTHEIVAGVSPFAVHSEQYFVHYDPAITVHATTTFEGHPDFRWIAGTTMPVVWTKRWGDGRVFVCTVGHKVDDFDVPQVRTMIERGMLWAARP